MPALSFSVQFFYFSSTPYVILFAFPTILAWVAIFLYQRAQKRAAPPVPELDRSRSLLRQMCFWAALSFVISLGMIVLDGMHEVWIAMTGGCIAVLACCILCLCTRGAVPPLPVSALAALFCVIAGIRGTDDWFWWSVERNGLRAEIVRILRFNDWEPYAALSSILCILIPPIALYAIYRYQKAEKQNP